MPGACGASEQIGVGAVKRMRKRVTFCLAFVLALSLFGTSARCADIRSFTTRDGRPAIGILDTARCLLQIDDEITMDGTCRVSAVDHGFQISGVYGGEANVIMVPIPAGVLYYGRFRTSEIARMKNYGQVRSNLYAESLLCWDNARFRLCITTERTERSR